MSLDRHKSWTWCKPESFAFARELRSVPVTLAQAVSAASCFALVFVSAPSGLMLHALLRRGAQGTSPFIGPQGQWQAAWLPTLLSAWPFDLLEAGTGHAFALHETCDQVITGPGGTPIFEGGHTAGLSPETARMAAILRTHAEALPRTSRATAALRDHGLLGALDGDVSIATVDPAVAADLDEQGIIALHQSGALSLLHASVVSLAHLPWMEKAEQRRSAIPSAGPLLLLDRKNDVARTSFLTALAEDISANDSAIYLKGSI